MFRLFLIMGLFGLVSACATLTKDECTGADWFAIGFEDGTKGRALSFFNRHVEACTKHGVVPQHDPWRKGREDGLRIFCVPERAHSIGRRGGSFPAVCTPSETIAMRPAWDWGREYYLIGQDISELESTISARREELAKLEDPEDPLFALYELYNFEDERRIRRLERRRAKYAHWPPRY